MQVDPRTVLTALQDHCTPSPLSSHVPSALRLSAHLTLVSDAIASQAGTALALNATCTSKLSAEEERAIVEIGERARERGGRMRAASLQIRRAHFRTCVPHLAVAANQGKPTSMLDSYFPLLPGEGLHAAVRDHPLLFISYMDTEDEIATLKRYRAEAEGWVAAAGRCVAEKKRWTPPKGRTYQELMREMLALCTGVVEDAEALMAIFEDAEVKQEQVDLAGG